VLEIRVTVVTVPFIVTPLKTLSFFSLALFPMFACGVAVGTVTNSTSDRPPGSYHGARFLEEVVSTTGTIYGETSGG
jgi:hypothetical protein